MLCEGYGLTETSPIVSANVPGMTRFGSVGRPLPNVRVAIEPSEVAEAPSGQIIVYGPNVMAGYHNRPGETRAAVTADGGLKTGDLGYLDDDGYLYITGRIKEQYKLTNGKYVVPSAIESALERSPFISEAMVCGDGQPCNVALIVANRDALLGWAGERGVALADAEALPDDPGVRELLQCEIERMNRGRKGYERVRAFRLLPRGFGEEEGLLTPSLKLRRHKVVERFRAELDALHVEAGAAPPSPECEDRLV
jgi:long-chain acyl-CoA synthetase